MCSKPPEIKLVFSQETPYPFFAPDPRTFLPLIITTDPESNSAEINIEPRQTYQIMLFKFCAEMVQRFEDTKITHGKIKFAYSLDKNRDGGLFFMIGNKYIIANGANGMLDDTGYVMKCLNRNGEPDFESLLNKIRFWIITNINNHYTLPHEQAVAKDLTNHCRQYGDIIMNSLKEGSERMKTFIRERDQHPNLPANSPD
jgi:hypothetical protein